MTCIEHRKVRCDAASLGVPCTNCVAFSIECRIPPPKRKKTQSKLSKDSDRLSKHHLLCRFYALTSWYGNDSDEAESVREPSPAATTQIQHHPPANLDVTRDSAEYDTSNKNGMTITSVSDAQTVHQPLRKSQHTHFMKPKFARAPIKEAGRVAYLGESSNLSLLVHDRHGTTDVVHYPLPDSIKGSRARLTELDQIEIEILRERGAFILPPRPLRDELVEAFFEWVAPVVPVINRGRFMQRYRDNINPPSLLLLQAILLAGSRVCTNPQLMDAHGSASPAAMTFYKRAKALYDANYEDDRVTIVQALVLMGWYWEVPEGNSPGSSFS